MEGGCGCGGGGFGGLRQVNTIPLRQCVFECYLPPASYSIEHSYRSRAGQTIRTTMTRSMTQSLAITSSTLHNILITHKP